MVTGTRIPTIDWTFGRRLVEARKLAGFTQQDMAERLTELAPTKNLDVEVKPATVNKWEHDQSQPRNFLEIVEMWSEITDVDRLWLLSGMVPEWAASDSNREPAESMLTLWDLEDLYLKSA